MSRGCWILALVVWCLLLVEVSAQISAKGVVKAQPPSVAEQRLRKDPDDLDAYSAYMSELSRMVLQSRSEEALAQLVAADKLIADLKPTQANSMMRLSSLRSTVDNHRNRLEVQAIPLAELEQKLAAAPSDVRAIARYVTKLQGEVSVLARTDPERAEQVVNGAKEVMAKIEPQVKGNAKQQLATAKSSLTFLERTIANERLTLAEFGEQLATKPGDISLLSAFYARVTREVSPILRSKPEEAAEKIALAKATLSTLREKSTTASVATLITNYERSLDAMANTVAAGKKMQELIGKPAAPLAVEHWVNGAKLSDDDLKGKVVFLDFWSVWCGPCIATFPHLREWNEQYADKGLVMIGLTRFYNYHWDEAAGKAVRAQEKVPVEDELAMLEKFAGQHDLHHRFAVQVDSRMSSYYGVTGIPHVVIIDREGKVRLMKVGSGEANAKEIAALLAELLDK